MSSVSTSLSRSEYATSRLREEILNGIVTPGTRLAEAAVGERLGVSRVPVREALTTLQSEGLIEFSSTGRAFVKQLTSQDFDELFTVRMTLEPMAARLAAATFKKDVSKLLKNVAATRKATTMQELTRLDLDFHEMILRASGNTRLLKLWLSLRGELDLWLGTLHREYQRQTMGARNATASSHEEIIDCFLTKSPTDCERMLSDHIDFWLRSQVANESEQMSVAV